jgi:DNA polymerase V
MTDNKWNSNSDPATIPVMGSRVAAGFPSPADEYLDQTLNLHSYLVRNPPATFFVRVTGDSMRDAGILDGDLLVVDRSLDATPGRIVVASIDGELLVKRLKMTQGRYQLACANPAFPDVIEFGELSDVQIFGVVRASISEHL